MMDGLNMALATNVYVKFNYDQLFADEALENFRIFQSPVYSRSKYRLTWPLCRWQPTMRNVLSEVFWKIWTFDCPASFHFLVASS